MAKNKNKLKNRKKKQLKKSLKQIRKQSEKKELNIYYPPYEEPTVHRIDPSYEKRKEAFKQRLDEVYNGTVTPLNNYINEHATLCFKCHSCGVRFFAKPCHLVGKEHQRHECNMPYGDKYGERLSYVSGTKSHKKKGANPQEVIKTVNDMIWDDYNYRQVASKLQVNPVIIKEYFEAEGLI